MTRKKRKTPIDPEEWCRPIEIAEEVEENFGIAAKTVQWWISRRRDYPGLEDAVMKPPGSNLLLIHKPTFYEWFDARE